MNIFRNRRYDLECLERKLNLSASVGNVAASAVYSTFDPTAQQGSTPTSVQITVNVTVNVSGPYAAPSVTNVPGNDPTAIGTGNPSPNDLSANVPSSDDPFENPFANDPSADPSDYNNPAFDDPSQDDPTDLGPAPQEPKSSDYPGDYPPFVPLPPIEVGPAGPAF